MIPKIIIDDFSVGILEDKTIQARNGFSYCAGMDIFSEPGILKASQVLTAETQADSPNNITDAPTRIIKYGDYWYVLGGTGRIYNNSANWILVHTDTNSGVGQSMIVFNGNLHWMGNTTMGKFDGTTWTDSFKTGFTSSSYHPMIIFENSLRIGNGRYVATWDGSAAPELTDLTLPTGYTVRTLEIFGNRIIIGATKEKESTLFSWDGVSSLPEQLWEIREPYLSVIKNWNNLLWIFGGEGNIHVFNGAILTKLPKKIPFYPDFTLSTFVRPGAITESQGNLIFGFGLSSFNYGGIYMIEPKSGYPLTIPYLLSVGQTGTEPFSIAYIGAGKFYVGWKSGSNYGIDLVNTSTKVTSPYWESQIYEISITHNPVLIKGFEIIAKPMATGTSITVQYKTDDAASWTSWGTINPTNQSKVYISGIGLAKTIQIRLEFTTSANNSPEIKTIKIY